MDRGLKVSPPRRGREAGGVRIVIPRYTRDEMGRIWSDAHRYEKWLEVELAVCDTLAESGQIPSEAAARIRRKAAFDPERVLEIERTVQHDVIAFLTSVGEHVGPDSRFIHLGLTSSDVVDTANALLLKEAADLILAGIDRVREALKKRAFEHRRTPCVGRTHGIHAEPTTFGLKMAVFYAEFGRARERVMRAREAISVGKISGAVGTFAHLDPAVEEKVWRASEDGAALFGLLHRDGCLGDVLPRAGPMGLACAFSAGPSGAGLRGCGDRSRAADDGVAAGRRGVPTPGRPGVPDRPPADGMRREVRGGDGGAPQPPRWTRPGRWSRPNPTG